MAYYNQERKKSVEPIIVTQQKVLSENDVDLIEKGHTLKHDYDCLMIILRM